MRVSKGEAASIASAALLAVLAIIWIATHDVDIDFDVYTKAKWEEWGDRRDVATVAIGAPDRYSRVVYGLSRGELLVLPPKEPCDSVTIRHGNARIHIEPGTSWWFGDLVARCERDSAFAEGAYNRPWNSSFGGSHPDTVYTRRGTDASD